MQCAPWATSLRCHGALGVPPATLQRVSCDAWVTCFHSDLTALVLSMFKTWRRPHCDMQRCYGALWDLTTTQRRSGQFCRSQRCRRPVWLGYNSDCSVNSLNQLKITDLTTADNILWKHFAKWKNLNLMHFSKGKEDYGIISICLFICSASHQITDPVTQWPLVPFT